MSKAPSQAPAPPAQEIRTVDVTIVEKEVQAPATVAPGALTFSFSNETAEERTAEIEGPGGPWRIDRKIPPHRSMTLEVFLEPGEYVLVSAGRKRLTAKLQVVKP